MESFDDRWNLLMINLQIIEIKRELQQMKVEQRRMHHQFKMELLKSARATTDAQQANTKEVRFWFA